MPATSAAAYTDYQQPGHVIVASSGDNRLPRRLSAYPATHRASSPSRHEHQRQLRWPVRGRDGLERRRGRRDAGSGRELLQPRLSAPSWEPPIPPLQRRCWAAVAAATTLPARARRVRRRDPNTGLEIYQSFDPDISALQVLGGTSLPPADRRRDSASPGLPRRNPVGGCRARASCAAYAPYANQADACALHDITAATRRRSATSASPGRRSARRVRARLPTGVGTPTGRRLAADRWADARPTAATSIGSSSVTLTRPCDPRDQSARPHTSAGTSSVSGLPVLHGPEPVERRRPSRSRRP